MDLEPRLIKRYDALVRSHMMGLLKSKANVFEIC